MDSSSASSPATEEVIPFPPPADPELRLRRALLALDRALGEQRAAVSAWRNSLAGLEEAMGRLGTSTVNYRSALDRLAGNVATLHGRMTTLAETMERAEEAAGKDQPEVTKGQPPSLSGR